MNADAVAARLLEDETEDDEVDDPKEYAMSALSQNRDAAALKALLTHSRLMRTVDIEGYRLRLYDVHGRDEAGRWRVGYVFSDPGGRMLFSGADIYGHDAVDSDETVRSIIGWLTLKPGDTDDEYFEKYTPEQMAFAEGPAEQLSIYGLQPEEDDECLGSAPGWTDVDIDESEEDFDPKEYAMDTPMEWVIKVTDSSGGVWYFANWSNKVTWVRHQKDARGFATKEDAQQALYAARHHFIGADEVVFELRIARKPPNLSA